MPTWSVILTISESRGCRYFVLSSATSNICCLLAEAVQYGSLAASGSKKFRNQ